VKLAVLALALAALLAGAARQAGAERQAAPVLRVSTPAGLQAAIARARSGSTIRLAGGVYPGVVVTRQFSAPVTIRGSRSAHLPGITFFRSANVTLEGVTIEPTGSQRVTVLIRRSSGIKLDHVLIAGRSEAAGAWVGTDATDSAITVQKSELTNCGESNRCIQPGAQSIRILDNHFHDCLDCDFIRGGGAGSVVIRGNTFDRAVPGSCKGGEASCNHNNLIQIMGGGPWTITRNTFGEASGGGASVFISTGRTNTSHRIHDVTVASNVFPNVGGRSGLIGVRVSAGGAPRNVSIVNNTILFGKSSGVVIVPQWASQPRTARPLVANNILARSNGTDCIARTSHNLVEQGRRCSGDLQGPAHLDRKGSPTQKSSLVLGKANPAYTPAQDYYGRRPASPPDIGAIQSSRG
jgi:hypothetical protein